MSDQNSPQTPKDSGFPPNKAPRPPFGQVGNQGKSALRRENFLCNLADSIVPLGLFINHTPHHRGSIYKAGNFKKADVDAELEDDDWVHLTDKTTKSGPVRITPREASSPERSSRGMGSLPALSTSPGFDQVRLSAGTFGDANVAWAITEDTDMGPAVIGEADNSKFVLRRYDIRDPGKVQKKRLELNIDGFDWNNEEHVGRLNKARRQWEILTLESNPQTSGKSRVTVDGRASPIDTFVGIWSPGEDDIEGLFGDDSTSGNQIVPKEHKHEARES